MASKRWYSAGWFLLLFNLGLFLLLAEVALRVSGHYKNYGERNSGVFIDYFKHPYPGPLCAWTPNIARKQENGEFDYELRTNSLGIRDVEHSVTKPKGTKRLLVLGDSFTEGMGAPFDSTWHQRLLWYMQKDTSLGPWEVIVGGVSGSDPFYAYEMLRRELMLYQPDLLLVVYNYTEVMDYKARGGMERFVNDSTTQLRPPKSRALNFAYKWSHLVRLVVKDVLGWNDYYQSAAEEQQLEREAIEKITDVYSKIDSLARSQGAATLFVFQPLNYECHNDSLEQTSTAIMKAISNAGMQSVSLLQLLPDSLKRNYQQYYWPIDAHMNSKGYNAWGRSVYDYLKKEGTFN